MIKKKNLMKNKIINLNLSNQICKIRFLNQKILFKINKKKFQNYNFKCKLNLNNFKFNLNYCIRILKEIKTK